MLLKCMEWSIGVVIRVGVLGMWDCQALVS